MTDWGLQYETCEAVRTRRDFIHTGESYLRGLKQDGRKLGTFLGKWNRETETCSYTSPCSLNQDT